MSFVVEVEAFDDAVMCESPCWQSPSLKRQLWKQIFKLENIKYQTKNYPIATFEEQNFGNKQMRTESVMIKFAVLILLVLCKQGSTNEEESTCPFQTGSSTYGYKIHSCFTLVQVHLQALMQTINDADAYCRNRFKNGQMAVFTALDKQIAEPSKWSPSNVELKILNGGRLKLKKIKQLTSGTVRYTFQMFTSTFAGNIYTFNRMNSLNENNSWSMIVPEFKLLRYDKNIEKLLNIQNIGEDICTTIVKSNNTNNYSVGRSFLCNDIHSNSHWNSIICKHDPYENCLLQGVVKCKTVSPQKCILVNGAQIARNATQPYGKQCDIREMVENQYKINCPCKFDEIVCMNKRRNSAQLNTKDDEYCECPLEYCRYDPTCNSSPKMCKMNKSNGIFQCLCPPSVVLKNLTESQIEEENFEKVLKSTTETSSNVTNINNGIERQDEETTMITASQSPSTITLTEVTENITMHKTTPAAFQLTTNTDNNDFSATSTETIKTTTIDNLSTMTTSSTITATHTSTINSVSPTKNITKSRLEGFHIYSLFSLKLDDSFHNLSPNYYQRIYLESSGVVILPEVINPIETEHATTFIYLNTLSRISFENYTVITNRCGYAQLEGNASNEYKPEYFHIRGKLNDKNIAFYLENSTADEPNACWQNFDNKELILFIDGSARIKPFSTATVKTEEKQTEEVPMYTIAFTGEIILKNSRFDLKWHTKPNDEMSKEEFFANLNLKNTKKNKTVHTGSDRKEYVKLFNLSIIEIIIIVCIAFLLILLISTKLHVQQKNKKKKKNKKKNNKQPYDQNENENSSQAEEMLYENLNSDRVFQFIKSPNNPKTDYGGYSESSKSYHTIYQKNEKFCNSQTAISSETEITKTSDPMTDRKLIGASSCKTDTDTIETETATETGEYSDSSEATVSEQTAETSTSLNTDTDQSKESTKDDETTANCSEIKKVCPEIKICPQNEKTQNPRSEVIKVSSKGNVTTWRSYIS
ncbi:Ghilanten [Trichinella pseudospiralis]